MRRSILALVTMGLFACGGNDEMPVDAGLPPDANPDASFPICPDTVPDGWGCVPAGEFQMGSSIEEPLRDSTDETQHIVRITQVMLVKATEVTQAEWLALMGNNPAWFSAGLNCSDAECERRPVERISWFDALAYCNALSEAEGLAPCYTLEMCTGTPGVGCEPDRDSCLEGYRCASFDLDLSCDGYRLPTESEWEYAARGGAESAQYGALRDIAWESSNAARRTHSVAKKLPNAYGLFDMLGNVGEWTWDRYAPEYGIFRAERMTNIDPIGSEFGDTRVIRGGAWVSGSRYTRAAARENDFPAKHTHTTGFRPMRVIMGVPAQ